MLPFRKLNNWISDHKILSGFAGVLVIVTVTIFFNQKENANESGNINFGNDTEITNSNVSGRDINIGEDKLNNSDVKADSAKQELSSIPLNDPVKNLITNPRSGSGETDADSKTPSNKTKISHSYIAGRDININQKNQEELIETLKLRAEYINKNLKDYYYYTEVAEFLEDFNDLHKRHINALQNNDFLLAHEILSRIHRLSFSLDSKEEEAQQINLYGDVRTQYLTSLDRENLLGGIISLYFQKNISPYDSTCHRGSVVYFNQVSRLWPGYPFINDSIKEFYQVNFLK